MADSKYVADTNNLNQLTFSRNIPSAIISFHICMIISLGFVLSSDKFIHWFVIPVTFCGILIVTDAIDWIRGKIDVFDPVGLLGMFGILFFYLSPLLHIAWDYQMLYINPIDDWRPWLGEVAIINLIGIILYRWARGLVRLNKPQELQRVWKLDTKLLFIILFFALAITFGLQILVYQQFGGVAGYIGVLEERLTGTPSNFTGFGALFVISESFPLLLFIGFAVYAHQKPQAQSWWVIFLVLFIFFAIRIFFGGLRGSRSNTIFAMVWALGVVHFFVRPIPRRFIYVGLIFSVFFLYIFGFFKALGTEFVTIFTNPAEIPLLEQQTNRTFTLAVLGDLGRASVQGYLLYRITDESSDYQYGWGTSYIAGLLAPIPSAIWPNKPVGKVKLGTEALYGLGTYDPQRFSASQVYGLVGEAILNFGPLVAPLFFIPLGIFVGFVRRWSLQFSSSDARLLLLPLLILYCILLLTGDSDVNAIYLVQQGLMPFLVIWLSSNRQILA